MALANLETCVGLHMDIISSEAWPTRCQSSLKSLTTSILEERYHHSISKWMQDRTIRMECMSIIRCTLRVRHNSWVCHCQLVFHLIKCSNMEMLNNTKTPSCSSSLKCIKLAASCKPLMKCKPSTIKSSSSIYSSSISRRRWPWTRMALDISLSSSSGRKISQ